MSKQNEGHYSHQPTLQHHSQEDNNAFIIDSKIRITSAEIFEDRGKNKKKTKPLIPAHFKSIIKKDAPTRLVDNLKIVTMKKILVDKLQLDLAGDFR